MPRNRYHGDFERSGTNHRKESRGGDEKYGRQLTSRHPENYESDEDPNDFESYAYEYKSHSYLRSPKATGDAYPNIEVLTPKRYSPERASTYKRDHPKDRYYVREKERMRGSNYPMDYPNHIDHLSERDYSRSHANQTREHPREADYSRERHSKQQQSGSRNTHRERALLNMAATKIQAAFRGYQSRKDFWRQREHSREMQHHSNSDYRRQDEYSLPSMTSIADNGSVSALAANADPNLGLLPPLPPIDSAQRAHILRELKAKMTFSDEMPTATQLQTENSPTILILGGLNPYRGGDYILGGSMFVYNVQRDKWLYAGTMPEPRNFHGAAYLNGKVYITGGYSPLQIQHGQAASTQTTFQLTVRSKRWRRRADMHQARACHGTCLMEDNIMVLGGRDSTGKLLSTVEIYYPKRDQWTLAKPMPEAIMGMACAVLDGCVWVIGGIVNEGHSTRYAVSNRVYVFDIQQQSWFHKPSLPEPRAFCGAVSLKREMWLWCGVKDELSDDGFLMSSNTVYVFSPEVSKWEQHASIGTAKHAMAITKFGRRVYLLGGICNVLSSKEVLTENDYYNRENDRYSEGAPLPVPLTGTAAVALPADYVATSDPKWNLDNLNETVLNEAATKIQASFRGYKIRKLISDNRFPLQSSDADFTQRSFHSTSEFYSDKWKLYQRVQIDDWPPVPDPKNISSELNLRLGSFPKGYNVTSSGTSGRTKVKRYVLLPEHVDPNLGLFGHICNTNKKMKKLLGLRKVEHLPSFARDMRTVSNLQDDSFPVILVMGGLEPREPVNLSYGKLIMRYNPLKDYWEYFGVLPEPRNYHAAVYYRECVYVTGGCDPDKCNSGEMVATNTLYCLNIKSSEWIQKSEMHCTRSHHCLIAFQGKLYAVGGRDQNGRLVASIEVYDIENDKWILKHPMSHPRMGMACVAYQDHIWVLGGIGLSDDSNSINYPVLSSVISYDIAKDSWIPRPPLRCPRAFGTGIICQNTIWLFGGASKDRVANCLNSMASVDRYYPEEAQWMRRGILNTPRHAAAIVAVENCIYVFGGISSQSWSAVSKNEMVILDKLSLHGCQSLPLALTGLAAVAIPPVLPSLRAESVSCLLHAKLTFY